MIQLNSPYEGIPITLAIDEISPGAAEEIIEALDIGDERVAPLADFLNRERPVGKLPMEEDHDAEIVIVSGVPVPSQKAAPSPQRYPWSEMTVGHSFIFPRQM